MSANAESVYEKISNEYYNLTASEKKVADYVMAHQKQTQFLSISELSGLSGVAEATVSRFSRRLGYRGFSAFKLAVASFTAPSRGDDNPLSGEVQDEDSFADVCRKLYNADVSAMTQTLELLKPESIVAAADLLEAAGKVLCMGQGGSMIMAEEAAHLFSTASGKFFAVSDSHIQAIAATTMQEKDVLLFFSYSGAPKDMLDTLALARERGARTIVVTHFPNAPGALLADVVLQCGANESPLQLGSIAARIAQLYLLDVLFSELCLRNLPECRESRRRIAGALAGKHLQT